PAVTTGSFKDAYDTGTDVSGYVSARFHGMFGWRAEAGYDSFGTSSALDAACTNQGIVCEKAKGARFLGGVQGNPYSKTFPPYAFFTIGIVHISESALVGSVRTHASDTRFGWSFGGGVNWNVRPNWGFGVDVPVVGFNRGSNLDTYWYVAPKFEMFWRF